MVGKNILIVAGEASSDLHAANLIKALKELNRGLSFFGLGGEKMKDAGCDINYDIVSLAIVGFFEVIRHFGKFKQIFNQLLKRIDKTPTDLAILVDYPGFNLRLVRQLKKRRIPIIYYISPQVWAWGRNRIKTIKKLIDKMIVFFKFEEELYRKEGIPVNFVGHPLLDQVKASGDKQQFLNRWHLPSTKFTIAILPGSRTREVKVHLPIMLKTARLLHKELNDVQFLILRSSTVKEEVFNKILSNFSLPAYVISDMTYEGLAVSDFALVASGTATLETAILGIPMAIIYKVSFLTWLYLRAIIKLPYIGMVNIVTNEKIVPEFIQYQAQPKKIANYIISTLTDQKQIEDTKQGLSDVKQALGQPGATQRASHLISTFLNN